MRSSLHPEYKPKVGREERTDEGVQNLEAKAKGVSIIRIISLIGQGMLTWNRGSPAMSTHGRANKGSTVKKRRTTNKFCPRHDAKTPIEAEAIGNTTSVSSLVRKASAGKLSCCSAPPTE